MHFHLLRLPRENSSISASLRASFVKELTELLELFGLLLSYLVLFAKCVFAKWAICLDGLFAKCEKQIASGHGIS
jgi:hypothetical protein